MAICLLVITIVVNVNKSDDFHENKDRIYRIQTKFSDKYSVICLFLYPTIKHMLVPCGKEFFNFIKIWSINRFPATFRKALGLEYVKG